MCYASSRSQIMHIIHKAYTSYATRYCRPSLTKHPDLHGTPVGPDKTLQLPSPIL